MSKITKTHQCTCFVLKAVPPNTEVFLRGLWLCGRSISKQGLLESKKKIGGNHEFFRDD